MEMIRKICELFLKRKIFHFFTRKLLSFPGRPMLHPYFIHEQKKTIRMLCKKISEELIKKKFCKRQDLIKYGYLDHTD